MEVEGIRYRSGNKGERKQMNVYMYVYVPGERLFSLKRI